MKLNGSITNLGILLCSSPRPHRWETARSEEENWSVEKGSQVRACEARDAEFGEKAAGEPKSWG